MSKLQRELEEIENRLDAKRVECLAARENVKGLDDEYTKIEAEWFEASRELRNE